MHLGTEKSVFQSIHPQLWPFSLFVEANKIKNINFKQISISIRPYMQNCHIEVNFSQTFTINLTGMIKNQRRFGSTLALHQTTGRSEWR